nr:hypothetical protein BaRGS_000303 [Batillaria attramentaria]
MSSLILTMGSVMNDLAQNTELAEAFAAVFSNQRLVIALQNYAVNAELTQAFDVFKILVESLNTTDPLIQQAVLTRWRRRI